MKNGINIYSKVEKSIAVSEQHKNLFRMAKDGYDMEQMPQSGNSFERWPEI